MSEQDIIDGLIKKVNSEARDKSGACPGCGNTGLDSSHSWCQVCGGDSATAMQTIRHAFIAGAESRHPQGHRVGGYVYRTPDDAANAYLDAQTSAQATRSDLVVEEGVTLPVGEKPASQQIEDEGIAVNGIEDDPFPCARCAGTKKVLVAKAETGPHLYGPCPDCFAGEKKMLMHPEHFTLLEAAEAIANDFKDDSLHGPDYVTVSRTGFDLLMGVLEIKRFKDCRHRVAFGDHCPDCEEMKA